MKVKILFTILIVFLLLTKVTAQTAYHFKYSFDNNNDSAVYHAFLMRSVNGSGFIRVWFTDPELKANVLINMKLTEQYKVVNGVKDRSKLYLTGSDPQFISGNKTNYDPDVFLFKMNSDSGWYEPEGVVTATAGGKSKQGKFSFVDLVNNEDLTKALMSEFFLPGEPFYENLFKPKARGVPTIGKATKIILLVVANTEDETIGVTCTKDLYRTLKTFSDLAGFLRIKIDTTIISGKKYGKALVDKAINALSPDPNDIVIFYYTGHGFHVKGANRKFPNIELREKPADDYVTHSLNMEDIFKRIKKKGARFNLVLSDCCNNDPKALNSVGADIVETRGGGVKWSEDNCRALFMAPERKSILMTAADVGQYAASTEKKGGYFSFFFKIHMEEYFSKFKSDVKWDDILQEVKDITATSAADATCPTSANPKNPCRQYPKFIISNSQ